MTDSPDGVVLTKRQKSAAASRERTQLRLLDAADTLFVDLGYVATSVGAIAARGEVTVQTLYLAWGSKSALFRACAMRSLAGSELPLSDQEWRQQVSSEVRSRMVGTDHAEAFILALADVVATISGRAGRYWILYQEAAVVDPAVNEDWQNLAALRRRTFRATMEDFPTERLRGDLTLDEAADTLWAIASPEMYRLLAGQGEGSGLEFRHWLRRTMVAAVVS